MRHKTFIIISLAFVKALTIANSKHLSNKIKSTPKLSCEPHKPQQKKLLQHQVQMMIKMIL